MIVSFSRLGNYGRIGNQLFQIASTLGIAEANKAQASFPAWAFEKYFEDKLPHHGNGLHKQEERQYHYEPITIERDTDLHGYFQSYKYFPANYKPRLNKSIAEHWKRHEAFNRETIAIHIRRGDYVGHELYYQLPITWYISALTTIPNWSECNIIICSDDLEYCRVHFECLPNVFFLQGGEIDHLCIMSLCDNHIIGNSTFGWWGAYMSEQKKVIHSGKMFRGGYSHKNIKDFYPPNWIEHSCEKINLGDVTFTIPVLYDHPDRKNNLDISLCVLQSNFETNIIVGEQGKSKIFDYVNKWVRYHYFNGMAEFHRTKMLNDMAGMADTEIIANWDADILIPPMQVYLCVKRLRSGVDCVYPYDGRFARMERRNWFNPLQKFLDIGIVRNANLYHRKIKSSVGGALMWRREAFFDFGMENEYMISYAPEDVERWERMHKLGVNVQRIDGTLYHIDHYKGPDSHNGNKHFPNSKKELERMRQMSREQMQEYVDSWPWRHKYTESYYNRISEGAVRSAKILYEAIGFKEGSVIDVGCGVGEWCNGNPLYTGVDHNVPIKALMIPEEKFIDIDLETAESISEKKYDLCLCLEVAEHISEARADWLVNQLCLLSDTVLFSAAIPNQGGTGHINEQWQEYWAEKFYKNGFGGDALNTIRGNNDVEIWYRQNVVLYKKQSTGRVSNFVLPQYYQQITDYLKNR